MRMLFSGQGIAGSPDVRPGVSVVWRKADPTSGSLGFGSRQIDRAQAQGLGRLDGSGTRGVGIAPSGKATRVLRAEWPGKVFGVRAPQVGETPVSASEWPYLFRGDLQGEIK